MIYREPKFHHLEAEPLKSAWEGALAIHSASLFPLHCGRIVYPFEWLPRFKIFFYVAVFRVWGVPPPLEVGAFSFLVLNAWRWLVCLYVSQKEIRKKRVQNLQLSDLIWTNSLVWLKYLQMHNQFCGCQLLNTCGNIFTYESICIYMVGWGETTCTLIL